MNWREAEKGLIDLVISHDKIATKIETPFEGAPEILITPRCGVRIVRSEHWRITFSDGSTQDL